MLIVWNGPISGNDLTPNYDQADQALIIKSERKLYLYKAGKVLQDFDIALGTSMTTPHGNFLIKVQFLLQKLRLFFFVNPIHNF